MGEPRSADRRSGRLLFVIAIVVVGLLALAILANVLGVGPWAGSGSQPNPELDGQGTPDASAAVMIELGG